MVIGIGNTADFGTSGLDDGQAVGLLSAVSGYGLPVVEPGPTPDPVAAGLKAAMFRARRLWEQSQPQMVLEGWADMLDGLDRPQTGALRSVEPVSSGTPLPLDGLALTYDGPDARSCLGARRGQEGA